MNWKKVKKKNSLAERNTYRIQFFYYLLLGTNAECVCTVQCGKAKKKNRKKSITRIWKYTIVLWIVWIANCHVSFVFPFFSLFATLHTLAYTYISFNIYSKFYNSFLNQYLFAPFLFPHLRWIREEKRKRAHTF